MKLTIHIIELTIGCVLLITGLIHNLNPYYFLQSIFAYDLVSFPLATGLAAVLPPLQIILGFCLIFSLCRHGALFVSAALFLVFGVAGMEAKINGLAINCGCFGAAHMPVTWLHVVLVFGLALACIKILLRPTPLLSSPDHCNNDLAL